MSRSGITTGDQLRAMMACLTVVAFFGCTSRQRTVGELPLADRMHYVRQVNKLDYCDPAYSSPTVTPSSAAPNSVVPLQERKPFKLSLFQAVQYALSHSEVLRRDAQFLSVGNTLLRNPERAPSIYDPVIQDSSILFGNRGIEAALSDFSPRLQSSMIWGRDERIQNNLFVGGVPPGQTLAEETGAFSLRLEKLLRTGGTIALSQNVNYSGADIPSRLFLSEYAGDLSFEFNQPLLAGAGVDFTEIAGPASSLSQREPTTGQGVLIAKINTDVAQLELENNVRQLIKDVADVYWELYFAHRRYQSEVTASDVALSIWEKEKAEFEAGRATAAREAEAADNYYLRKAQAEQALTDLNTGELRVRRLLQMGTDDGTYILPVDSPLVHDGQPLWGPSVWEAMARRVELRRTKWNIRSLQLQLKAARSLTRPNVDFVAGYRRNGFGDQLLSRSDNDGVTTQGLRSYYATLAQGSQSGWDLGFVMSMPLGFRLARAHVNGLELQLVKLRAALAAQEQEVAAELSSAFNQLQHWQQVSTTNDNRRSASERRVNSMDAEYAAGRANLDDVLRARTSHTQAEIEYFRSLSEYMKAVNELHFRKGSLVKQHVTIATSHQAVANRGSAGRSAETDSMDGNQKSTTRETLTASLR